MRAARLRNAASSRNRGRSAAPMPPGVREVALDRLDTLDVALAELAAEQTELLLIDGGDGTLREIASRLPETFPSRLPRIGMIANGNTNLAARHAGAVRADRVEAILRGEGRERRLRLLRADREGERPLRGFILGWGAYESATRMAAQERRGRGGAQVARVIGAVLRRSLIGAEAATLRRGVHGGIGPAPALAGVATTLEGPLLLGLNPFWGPGAGPIRWTEAAAPGRRLSIGLVRALAGRPARWMERAGYLSGRAETLTLRVPVFVMDGERIEATAPVRLSAREELRFVS